MSTTYRFCETELGREPSVTYVRYQVGYPAENHLSGMTFAQKIVLHCPRGYRMGLDALIRQFVADGVKYVGVVGENVDEVSDIIIEILAADPASPKPFIAVSLHRDEAVSEAVEFARVSMTDMGNDEPQVVLLDA